MTTELMWTDKEYLNEKFRVIEMKINAIETTVNSIDHKLTDNRVELAKSGGLAMVLIALAEIARYGIGIGRN